MTELMTKATKLKKASQILAMLSENKKNEALVKIAEALTAQKQDILHANEIDMNIGKEKGLTSDLLDRLLLTAERVDQIVSAIYELIKLDDPVGEVTEAWERPNGLKIESIRVPLGVIGMVYEARPNVTVDAAVICLKAGNAVLLRGSSSAINSNMALVKVMRNALEQTDIPVDALQLLEDVSRETANEMFQLNGYLDVLIPRGGAGLIQSVVKNATVPVLETGAGNCHVLIDASADKEMGINIAINAKAQRPSVCNAIETVVVHSDWPYMDDLLAAFREADIELHVDPAITSISSSDHVATEEDWKTEYLAPIIAVKQVDSIQDGITHINQYSTKHSEAIVSENEDNVSLFLRAVDAAALYHNASTRFTDGEEFGYGAEIGISTQKLHARGPMGLRALTTTKVIIKGNGHIRP